MNPQPHLNQVRSSGGIATSISLLLLSTFLFTTVSAQAATTKPVPKTSAKAAAKPTAKASPKAITKPNAMANPNANQDGGPRGEGFGARGAFVTLTNAQRSCLATNGFEMPVRPTGAPTFRPTDRPTARPTDMPNDGQGRGFGGNFDPAVMQAAFAKCGIELPTFGNRDDGAPGAGGAPALPGAKAPKVLPTKAAVVNPKQASFIKCMTTAGIKNSGAVLAYDQSDPDTAIALVKCQKSTGFVLPKKSKP